MAIMLTRLNVGDYEQWKPMFDQDKPGARAEAKGHQILRNVDNPGEVFLLIEYASAGQAKAGRDKLIASGVLDRFPDKSQPTIIEQAEDVRYQR